MKNWKKITRALKVLFVSGFLLSPSFLMAQSCNLTINNNFPCDLRMDIEFFETIPPCASCSGGTVNVTVLGNGGSTNLNCQALGLWNCANPICDISVTITNPFSAGAFLFSNGTQSITGNPCGSSSGANISFTATTIDINP